MAQQKSDAKAAATKAVDDAAKAKADAVAETEKRINSGKPTPTQRENDLAKLGALDPDEKEDDGSGPDPANQPLANVRALTGDQGGDYKTRNVAPEPKPAPHQDRKP